MPTKQLNTRIPEITQEQIDEIANEYGLTKTQILILAIDRLSRDLYPRADNIRAKTEAMLLSDSGDESGYIEQA
jgi:hypothetical protein